VGSLTARLARVVTARAGRLPTRRQASGRGVRSVPGRHQSPTLAFASDRCVPRMARLGVRSGSGSRSLGRSKTLQMRRIEGTRANGCEHHAHLPCRKVVGRESRFVCPHEEANWVHRRVVVYKSRVRLKRYKVVDVCHIPPPLRTSDCLSPRVAAAAVLTGANSRGERRPRTSAKAAPGRVRTVLQTGQNEGVPANAE
jgi:hypothetical protein